MTEDRSLSAEEAETARRIYCAYKNKMFSIALGILHDSHDAEDAVSESVVRIIRNIDRFKGADERLVKAGVNIILSARGCSEEELIRIAASIK